MPSTSAASASSRRRSSRDPNEELRSFTPSTKARKYNLKPATEKANPHYQLKRARNNDAVRKSRTKVNQFELENQRTYIMKIFSGQGAPRHDEKGESRHAAENPRAREHDHCNEEDGEAGQGTDQTDDAEDRQLQLQENIQSPQTLSNAYMLYNSNNSYSCFTR